MFTQRLVLLRSTRRIVTAIPSNSLRLVSPSPSPTFTSSSRGIATRDLPRAPPHNKVPFSAPPKDETKGDLGQVHLPEMIENIPEQVLKIPSEPDNYKVSTTRNESEDFPQLHQPKVHTVASPSTFPDGGPNLATESADDTFEGFKGDNELSARTTQTGKTNSQEEESSKSKSSSGEGEGEGEPLSQEDRIGLIKLGGFLFAGWFLSGLTRPYKPQHPHEKKEVAV